MESGFSDCNFMSSWDILFRMVSDTRSYLLDSARIKVDLLWLVFMSSEIPSTIEVHSK